MSVKSKSSSGSGSDTQEGIENSTSDHTAKTNNRRKKLGAHFFPDENVLTTATDRPKTPLGRSGLKKTWTTPSTRSRAALWPSDTTEPDDNDRNDNTCRPMSSFPRDETPGNYEGAAQTQQSDELVVVAEQLQIIQETQDLILSELRSDIESLQTENLCLQRNNSRLRIQVDHLNELVYELSKELTLMREFVNARKGQSSENNIAERAGDKYVASRSSFSRSIDKKAKAVAGPSRKKTGEKSKSKDALVDDKDSVKSSPSRSGSSHKYKDKASSTKNTKEKKNDEEKAKNPKKSGKKLFGFMSSIFKPRTPRVRSPTPSSRGSQSQQE